jgi:hypothetical protein
MNVYECNGKNIFMEHWNIGKNIFMEHFHGTLDNGTFHLSPNENILTKIKTFII